MATPIVTILVTYAPQGNATEFCDPRERGGFDLGWAFREPF